MKDKYSGENRSKVFGNIIFGVVLGLLTAVLLLVLFSVIMSLAGLKVGTAKVFSIIALIVAAFVCGLVTAKKAESKKLLLSALSGGAMYLVIVLISVAAFGAPFTATVIFKLLICVISSAVAAFVAVLRGSGKRFI